MKHIKLFEDFVNEAKHTVQVSLRYAQVANDIFQDQFKGLGKKEDTDTFKFKYEDDKLDFIDQLTKQIPRGEIFEATELKRFGNELWNRGGLDERKQLLTRVFGAEFQTEEVVKLPWSELPTNIRLKLHELKESLVAEAKRSSAPRPDLIKKYEKFKTLILSKGMLVVDDDGIPARPATQIGRDKYQYTRLTNSGNGALYAGEFKITKVKEAPFHLNISAKTAAEGLVQIYLEGSSMQFKPSITATEAWFDENVSFK
jgi:hypothetical protein